MRCDRLLVVTVSVAIATTTARAELLPNGVLNDEQTSIVYYAETGEVAVDAPASSDLLGIALLSDTEWTFDRRNWAPSWGAGNGGPQGLIGHFEDEISVVCWCRFSSLSFGNVAQRGLSQDFLLDDWTAVGIRYDGGDLGPVDLVYMHDLFPGDANRDFSFDQLDIVQVLQAGKYLTGHPATWGQGDWNGGPGGYPGEPPVGDGIFDQKDIVAALQTGAYLSGAYAAIQPGGVIGDEQTSIIYDARTGEIAVDAPMERELTSISIDSRAGIFWEECGFDCCGYGCINNIFKATFGSSFGDYSFGNVAQPGLSEDFVANDLTVVGSLAGGGDLGDVDLIYVPEPSTLVLLSMGLVITLGRWRRCVAA